MPPKKDKRKYLNQGKKGGPPRGGDGAGDFQGGPLAKYRSQPLVSIHPTLIMTNTLN
jgi:hypothetical protein